MWCQFMDMHSGGHCKEKPYEYIYIEAPLKEAKVIFYNRFGHNPDRVTCTCCGEDYSITESDSLEQASGYERKAKYDSEKYTGGLPLEDYLEMGNVLVIYDQGIADSERVGEVPQQGHVWVD